MEEAIPTHHLPERARLSTRVEAIVRAPGTVENGVHRHAFHELFFFGEGSGDHMIDLEHLVFRGPCMHVVAPGQVHRLVRSGDTTGQVVMFANVPLTGNGQEARTALFAPGRTPRSFPLSEAQLNEAMTLVEVMATESTGFLTCWPRS